MHCLTSHTFFWYVYVTLVNSTYGSFIRINTLQVKNERRMATNPTANKRMRFSRGVDGLLVWSRMMNPKPPRVKRKLEASPSMMYWPFTRYGMKATYGESGKFITMIKEQAVIPAVCENIK